MYQISLGNMLVLLRKVSVYASFAQKTRLNRPPETFMNGSFSYELGLK